MFSEQKMEEALVTWCTTDHLLEKQLNNKKITSSYNKGEVVTELWPSDSCW